MAGLPPALKVRELFDQSIFVRAAIEGVVKEAMIAAVLTGLMILLFLGSWRSTIIVCISIPLSILSSLIVLKLLGETINVMTLGGLALAVGILVDDATVDIENIHRNLAMQKPLTRAVLDGALQIAAPTFVSTLSICIVFVPVLLLTGAARFLFTPLAMAVVFAMLASYLLSRTLVPTMVHYLLGQRSRACTRKASTRTSGATPVSSGACTCLFNRRFERMRRAYTRAAGLGAGSPRARRWPASRCSSPARCAMAPLVGRDFFPTVDSGQMRLHARAPAGTRLEADRTTFGRIEDEIRQVIPASEIDTIIDNIGLPLGGINLAFGDSRHHRRQRRRDPDLAQPRTARPHRGLQRQLRKRLNESSPSVTFFFQAANITNQILNFGLPAPIDVQVQARNAKLGYDTALKLADEIARIPGAADVHVHQVVDAPEMRVNVDRTKAASSD